MNSLNPLFEAAVRAREQAYAPYSKFLVGAALRLRDSNLIFTGCNIENISYGATVCAERVAVFKALSENPGAKIKELLLITESPRYDVPCGLCLQVMSEFCNSDTGIHLASLKGIQHSVKFSDLMPFRFENDTVTV